MKKHKEHMHGDIGKNVNFLGTPEEYTEGVKKKTEEYVEKRDKRRKMMKGKIAEMKKMRESMPRYL